MATQQINQELQEQLRAELITLHAHFRDSQIAKEFDKILRKHEEKIINAQTAQCIDISIPDATIRHFAVQLQTIKTIRKLIYDTETFVTRACE